MFTVQVLQVNLCPCITGKIVEDNGENKIESIFAASKHQTP